MSRDTLVDPLLPTCVIWLQFHKIKKVACKLLVKLTLHQFFYEQLLCAYIPEAQNVTDNLTDIFSLLGSVNVKAAKKC